MLVNGLFHYFTCAIRNQDTRTHRSALIGRDDPHPPLYMIDQDYAKGCLLSKRLISINVSELLNADPLLFTSLANSLCMHAALDGQKDMHEIAEKYGDHYSYQIGDKIFLYSTLIAYAYNEAP